MLRLGVPFFRQRFPNMDWMIATPDGTALWRNGALQFVSTADKSSLPKADAHESLWRTYYRNICNVARINPPAMQRDMPKKYWHNLPEATEIHALLRDGQSNFAQRQREVMDTEMSKARAVQRALADLPDYSGGPAACRRCDIWRHALKPCLARAPRAQRSCWSANNPVTKRTCAAVPSSAPRDECWTKRCKMPGSIAASCTSPTPSNISNGSPAANAACTSARMVPVAKAYSGLSNPEVERLDRWIRAHTVEKFGPVRSVEPTQVFELAGNCSMHCQHFRHPWRSTDNCSMHCQHFRHPWRSAYEGIAASGRHKSGIALRFPRILRWRTDKPAAEADTLANLRAVLMTATGGGDPHA